MSSGVILNNIGNGELTVMLKRFSVINSCSIFKRIVSTKKLKFPVDTNLSVPFLSFLVPIDPLYSRFVAFFQSMIMAILSSRTKTKIVSSIVKTVMVLMVDLNRSFVRIHYYSMKVFAFICSIKRLTTENKRPFSFFDFFKIRNITKGISSCLSRYNAKSIFDIWKSLTVGCHGGIIW